MKKKRIRIQSDGLTRSVKGGGKVYADVFREVEIPASKYKPGQCDNKNANARRAKKIKA